ncbi:MAG: DUF3052 family protein [Nitratireductor sp.]
MAGYSASPLARKLGYGDPGLVWCEGMPDPVRTEIEQQVKPVWSSRPDAGVGAAHLFVTGRKQLTDYLNLARRELRDDAVVWISWPKKASGIPSEVTEDTVRELALPMGFVDIKVCAIDETWSGLKLVVRKELRISSRESHHG